MRPKLTVVFIVLSAVLVFSSRAVGQTVAPAQPEEALLVEARELEEDGEWELAREKFEEAIAAMEGRSASANELATVRHEYADVLVEWSEHADALVHFQRAVELSEVAGASFEELADLRMEAIDAQVQVDEDAAEQEYRDLLAEIERRLGKAHPLRAEARLSLGALFARQSWLEGAQAQFNIAFEPLQEKQQDSEELIELLDTAADKWFWVDENERAFRLRNEALEMRGRLSGVDSEAYLRALRAEAEWFSEWGYDGRAVELYRSVVERYEKDPEENAEALASSYSGLGGANWENGAQAEGAYRAAISLRRQAELHTAEQASDLRSLSYWIEYAPRVQSDFLTDAQEDVEEVDREAAEEVAGLLQESIEISRSLGEEGLSAAHQTIGELVDVLLALKKYEAAEKELRRQIALEEEAGDVLEDGLRAGSWERLGDLYLEQEDPSAVEAYGSMLALRESGAKDEAALQTSLEQMLVACQQFGVDDRAAELSARLRRIEWKTLAGEYEWLRPLVSRDRVIETLSPTAFFGGIFLALGLVVAGAGGTASIRIARASDRRAREDAPEVVDLPVDAPPTTHHARFHGDGRELFGIFVVNSLWSVLTLSIYYFWGKVRVRRYVWSHGEFAGDRFAYHGTPMELFVGWLKGSPAFAAVIWGPTIVLMYSQSSEAENYATMGVFALIALLWPIAEIGAHRYRMSRTSWRAIRFSFHGKTWRYALIYLLNWPVWLFTLGLWTPFFNAIKRRYLMNHMRFGDSRFACDASGRDLFKAYLVNWLLFIPTLGLYSFWYLAYRERYYWSRTTYRGARFRSTITGSQLFELTAVAGLLMVMTLGLAWPWVRTWRMKVWLESIELDGALDLHAIRQDPQAADATAEGVGDFLGVDFGFFE